MARIAPIEELHRQADNGATRIMLDANILIALLDSGHRNHAPIKALVRHLFMTTARLYYVQPAYLELLDFWRRKSFTEYLEEIYASGTQMPRRFDKGYRFHLDELRRHAGTRADSYFQDYVIKNLRDHLLNVGGKNQPEKGRDLWQDLCRRAFTDRIAKVNDILSKLRISYAKFADGDVCRILLGHAVHGDPIALGLNMTVEQ